MTNSVAFETLREDLVFLDEHLNRLWRSMDLLEIKPVLEITRDQIKKALKVAVKDLKDPSRVKILVDEQGFRIEVSPLDPWPQDAIEVDHMIYTRPQANAKYQTEHYVRVQDLIRKKGLTEMIFVDQEGFIREGNVTNIFLVIGGVLVTPQKKILQGIMRQQVIKKARELGIKVEEREVHLSEREKASEIFVTNALRGMVPVGKWGPWQSSSSLVKLKFSEASLKSIG